MADNYFARKRREREAQRVQVTGGDPKLPHETRKAANEAEASVYDPAQSAANVDYTRAQTARINAITPAQVRAANAQADRIVREANKPNDAEQKRQIEDRRQVDDLRTVANQLNRVQELFHQDIRGSSVGSVGALTPKQQRFESQAKALATLMKPLIRGPGEGTWTDADQRLLDRLVPNSWSSDLDNEERIQSAMRFIEERVGKFGGSARREPVSGPPPLDEQMSAQVDAMVNAGLPLDAINAALEKQGRRPIQSDDYAKAIAWKRENPGQRYFGSQIEQPDGFASSALGQGLSGANEGLASVLGAPADLSAGLINLATGGVNAAAGTNIPRITDPFLGSDQIKDALTAIGSIQAPNPDGSGQFVRRVGQSVGASAIPLAGAATTLPRFGAQLLAGAGGGVGGATAQQVAPGNPLAEMLGELVAAGLTAGGVTRAVRRQGQKKIEANVPTIAQLKQDAGQLYRAAESRGVVADPTKTQQLADDFRAVLTDEAMITPEGRITDAYPKARQATQLIDDYAGKEMTPTQMQSVRRVISDGLSSPEPAERRLGGLLTDTFDNFANPLAPELREARGLASRYLTAQQLERARELAGSKASQFTGSGFENALRTEYRGLDRAAIKGQKHFTNDVNDAIEKVARGTPASNFFRGLGRLDPTGPVSMMGSVVPAGVVGAMTDPATGALLGGLLAGGGFAGRQIATRMGIRAADEAELIARNGGRLPEAQLPPEWAEMLRRLGLAEGAKYLPE